MASSPARVYRQWREQARLLGWRWCDPYLYQAHAFLARRTVEAWRDAMVAQRHAIAARKAQQAEMRCRQLQWANAGWTHAISRALDQAYARRGALRHSILRALAPPHPSPSVGENARYPRRLRLPHLSSLVQTMILSKDAQRGDAPKPSALACPPKLALAYESVQKIPGHTLSRRRRANAHWRWFSMQWQRVRAPLGLHIVRANDAEDTPGFAPREQPYSALYAHVESRAASPGPTAPRRVRRAQNTVCESTIIRPRYLRAAQEAVTAMEATHTATYRKAARRLSSRLVTVTPTSRAYRRQYARILAQSPRIDVHDNAVSWKKHASTPPHSIPPWMQLAHSLQALTKAESASPTPDAKPSAAEKRKPFRIHLSPHALYSGKGPRTVRAQATPDEAAWLARGSQGLK
ncbi:hypothetical protein ACI68E_003262 [Malassezia pachydermatis]|uniref:LYR motif-containing protein Cup1-like N-terminal domain-containing protein n=1 Tax=Malassezia pachydermatis TaxID=77020 RepID=A0A0M8MPW8_9BASI|nr:hypothetical protein Malapachy_4103 [Malassezia pachydermatis]KOS14437.1 hypothetical protein Malapachy_4103 [Malassezia pachydermatis]